MLELPAVPSAYSPGQCYIPALLGSGESQTLLGTRMWLAAESAPFKFIGRIDAACGWPFAACVAMGIWYRSPPVLQSPRPGVCALISPAFSCYAALDTASTSRFPPTVFSCSHRLAMAFACPSTLQTSVPAACLIKMFLVADTRRFLAAHQLNCMGHMQSGCPTNFAASSQMNMYIVAALDNCVTVPDRTPSKTLHYL